MCHPRHIPLKKKKTKRKQAKSDLRDNQYRISAAAQVEATQKLHTSTVFDLCDIGALFRQLSNQVNWALNHGMGAS